MPKTNVAFYRETDGEAPVVIWLRDLLRTNQKAWAHCRARIELLGQLGHELRRPAADYLRDEFMNCELNKAMCDIECFTFSTVAKWSSWPTR
jgi:hypothetical protein